MVLRGAVAKEKPASDHEATSGDDSALRCAVCEHRITASEYRVERSGAFEHTFVNTGGFVHHIGCFAAAPGCIHIGDTQQAFTWFPGWTWQVALCARCHTHLGWIFRCAGDQFHGLILTAIR